MKAVTAAQANRQFSALLRDVAHGEHVLVTSRGRPVARILPVEESDAGRKAAKATLLARLRNRKVTGARTWSRNELYD